MYFYLKILRNILMLFRLFSNITEIKQHNFHKIITNRVWTCTWNHLNSNFWHTIKYQSVRWTRRLIPCVGFQFKSRPCERDNFHFFSIFFNIMYYNWRYIIWRLYGCTTSNINLYVLFTLFTGRWTVLYC